MTNRMIAEIKKKYPKFSAPAASFASHPEETGITFVSEIKQMLVKEEMEEWLSSQSQD